MDPRADNCKAYAKNSNGLIVGIELEVKYNPTAKYELYRVDLIDEVQNGVGGPTVAKFKVYDKAGIEAPERVYLAYPWFGYQNWLLPGSTDHVISNRFDPPNKGPLAIFVGDVNHHPISDEVGGFGLPEGHHVSFSLVFRERGAVDPDGDGSQAEVLAAIAALDAKVVLLGEHLGITL